MRTAIQLVLLLVASNLHARAQHFHQVTIPTGPSPRWIAVADVNHDRKPDIIVANAGSDNTDSGSITVLLGDDRGRFRAAPGSPFPAGHLPNDLAIADVNNDGNLDVVVAVSCAESRTFRIYQSEATGKFAATTLPIVGGWGSVAIAHLTTNPRGEIITANAAAGSITIYFPD